MWQRLLSHTGEVFYVHDIAGRFVDVNPAFYRWTGYSPADLPRLTVPDLVAPEDSEAHAAWMATLLRGGDVRFPVEMAIRCKDGSISYGEFAVTVMTGADGARLVVGVARDVTARKLADAELREAAAFQETLAEVSLALHAAPTLEALCPMICVHGRRLLGLAGARLFLVRGKELVMVAADGTAPFLENWVPCSLAQPNMLTDALRLGRTRALTAGDQDEGRPTLLVLPLSGRLGSIGVLAFYEPYTPGCLDNRLQQRADIFAMQVAVALENAHLLQDLQRADRLKTDFLASVSHDLRTPLNVIIGFTDIQLEGLLGPLTPDQYDALRRVRATTLSLAGLINATLDLNRLEAGRTPVESRPVDLGGLWAELMVQFEDHPDWGHVSLRWTEDGVPVLLSDPEKLKLIIRNLVGNALRFTRSGTVTVAAGYTPETRRLHLTVTDTGPGIAPADLPRIFDMFQQAGGGVQFRGGVGLGLYLVKRVVELLDGDITVTSEVGAGTRFRVTLPATPS